MKKSKPVKCAVKGCKERATSWINCKKYCVRHFYREQVQQGKAPRKLPAWTNGFNDIPFHIQKPLHKSKMLQ